MTTLLMLISMLEPTTAPAMPTPTQMQAIRVTAPGKADVLKLETIDRPSAGPGEILVRVRAAGVNPVDAKMRARARGTPYTPGYDVAGVVRQVGDGVTKFKLGDEVFAMLDLRRGGAYAEYAIVKENEAAIKPAKASFTDAGSVPLVTLTAWQALIDTAKIQPGQTVLIHGGTGGVGSAALQLAKINGARVIVTASADNHKFARELGADQTIDYRTEKFEQLVHDADVVLDTVGGDTQLRSLGVLKKGGILVSIVGIRPDARNRAAELGVRIEGILVHPSGTELKEIAGLIDAEKFKTVATTVLPLSEAARAHELIETGHTRGKIVLEVGNPPGQ